uniref:Uncharacterized protein MANES_05G147600 n=1 Tax=Rhizophora mucronata TaxID=61149 RepID=A0A2P2JKG6_RHIMU
MKATKRPIHAVATWVRRQPPKIKAFLAAVSGMTALVFLRMVVNDHDNLFVAAEAVHALGISVLIYKLMKDKTCVGNLVGFFVFFCFSFSRFAFFALHCSRFGLLLITSPNWKHFLSSLFLGKLLSPSHISNLMIQVIWSRLGN